MSKGKRIVEEKFLRIKALINGGADSKQIQEWENVGKETVRRIRLSETYNDYKKLVAIHHSKDDDFLPGQISFYECEDPILFQLQRITEILDNILFLINQKRGNSDE